MTNRAKKDENGGAWNTQDVTSEPNETPVKQTQKARKNPFSDTSEHRSENPFGILKY